MSKKLKKAVARGEAVIYQPEMKVSHPNHGDVVGRPDFFIRENAGYVIRDSKLSAVSTKMITQRSFISCWLYEQTFGNPPVRLEAYMGDGQIQTVPYQPDHALEVLAFIQGI